MSNNKDKVVSGLFWKFMERIFAQGTSMLVTIVLARMLMPEAYGIVAMVMVFINIANVFVTGGFSSALIQKKDATETDFSTLFYCSLAIACIIYGVLFCCAPVIARFYNTPELTLVLRVFSIRIIFTSYNSIQHAYVARHMIFKKFFFSTSIGTLISGVVGIGLALNGAGVWALVAQYLTNTIVDTMVLAFTIRWRPHLVFSFDSAKNLMRFGWKLLAANLIGTLYGNLRSLLIGKFYTSADLAYYNKGKNFPDLIINNVVTSISSVLFPAMSNAGGDAAVVKTMARRSLKTISYVVFPMMLGMALVARPFIIVLLTEKWEESVIYMQLICLYSAFHTITDANLQAINAMGRSDIVLKLEFIKKPVGLLMILVALPFGVTAVAASLPVNALFTMLVNMQPNRKLLNYTNREQFLDLLPSVILSICMGIVIYPLKYLPISVFWLLLLQIVLGIFTYIFLSHITKNESYNYIKEYAVGLIKRKFKKK